MDDGNIGESQANTFFDEEVKVFFTTSIKSFRVNLPLNDDVCNSIFAKVNNTNFNVFVIDIKMVFTSQIIRIVCMISLRFRNENRKI